MKLQDHEPAVRASWFGRRKIRLVLPLNAVTTMEKTELDVLLATGLARSICTRKPTYTPGRLLLASMVLIASIVLISSWMQDVPLVGFPITIALCVSVVWLMHMQARSIAFHACL
jgi:ribosomal protein S12